MRKEQKASLEDLAWRNAQKPVSKVQQVQRFTKVLSHYPWVQIGRRGLNVLKGKLQPGKTVGEIAGAGSSLRQNQKIESLADLIVSNRKDYPPYHGTDLASGKFVLLNQPAELGTVGDFDKTELLKQTHLWRFQFHYHEVLLQEAAAGNLSGIEDFLNRWLKQFPATKTKRRDDAWHPYCISRRIAVWIWLLHLSINESLKSELLFSLTQQANYLMGRLERDLGGNHLLENATALALASGCIDSPSAKSWGSLAQSVFAEELQSQVLPHGEHFELAPAYHCQVLSNLLRIETCCQNDSEMLGTIVPFIDPMLSFLADIVHPDKEIPLFADSVFHEAPSVDEIFGNAAINSRATPTTPNNTGTYKSGHYEVLKNGSATAIVDLGPIAAAKLPAHGHCDALNLVVSIGNDRWIIDSGNFNYEDDSMRHYCRSSLAHNVATIDGQNQAEIWSKFRMGGRPQVSDISRSSDGPWTSVSANHNGYHSLGVEKISRTVAIHETAIVCLDRATVVGNENSHRLCCFLHWHPDVEIVAEESAAGGTTAFRITRNAVTRRLIVLAENVSLETGWYCSEFGKKAPTTAIKYDSPVFTEGTGWILLESNNNCQIKTLKRKVSVNIDAFPAFEW